MSPQPQPFKISIAESSIADLKSRLSLARFPTELDDAAWDHGTPLADVKRLTAYWRDEFDWRKAEERLNELPQFTTEIEVDGGFGTLKIHFVHQKSEVERAVPLLFVHGWPGSFIEVSKVLPNLVKGDESSPAFHVVAVSLPNFGFSEGPKKRGFNLIRHAETCHKLMLQLGYEEYVTQGGDWGLGITRVMAHLYPQHVKANHYNMDAGFKPQWTKNPLLALQHALTPSSPRDKAGSERTQWFESQGRAYFNEHATRPQTIGYALQDSPVALLAWIYEKLHDWTDAYPWTPDEICTWLSIYWFSTAGPAASVRIYYESEHGGREQQKAITAWNGKVVLGQSYFPKEIRVKPKIWARTLGPVVFVAEHDVGGHFAAWEQPKVLVGDLRRMFGKGGGAYGVVKGKDGYERVEARL